MSRPFNADRCIKCGACMRACPVVQEESVNCFDGPRSIAVDSSRFSHEVNSLRDNLFACSMCWKCADVCPSRIEMPRAILRARADIFDRNAALPGHTKMMQNIDVDGLSVRRELDPLSLGVEKASVLYFPGCIAGQKFRNIADGAVRTLMQNSTVRTPSGLVCCGSPLEKTGDRVRMEALRKRNLKLFEGRSQVVTSCPGCTSHINDHYGIEALHIVEYLVESVGLAKLKFRNHGVVRVALHEPCHLKRTVGPHAIDYCYDILHSMPGIRVLDMPEPDRCCGGGGGLLSGYPDIAMDLAKTKIEDALTSGADVVLAPCPFCVLNLKQAGGMDVMDLTEFISFRF